MTNQRFCHFFPSMPSDCLLSHPSLPTGQVMQGPAILLQTDSTTVVPPGWSFVSDTFDNVLMTREEA